MSKNKKKIANQNSGLSIEEELRDLRERCALYEAWLRALDEYVDCDLWFKDADSHYLYVNKRFENIIGFSREQLLHARPEDIFDEDRAQRVRALDKKVMDENGLRRVVPCGTGSRIEMHDELRFPVKNDADKIIGLGCLAFEVTKQSIAEEALAQAQSLAQLGNWRWSLQDRCLISCSEEFAQILGCDIQDAFAVMHKRLEKVVHPDDRDRLEHCLKDAKRKAIGYKIEYSIIRADGEVRHVMEIGEPLLSSQGNVVEYIGTLQDISERKQIEEELICAKQDLEKRVEERTAHLKYMAAHDNLTQVLNRKAFTENVLHRLKTKSDEQSQIALIILDLNGFKGVNDYFGHDVGDKVLQTVAARIQNALPLDAYLSRIGGDEFAISIFGENDLRSSCERLCDRMTNSIQDMIHIDGLELFIGSSAGIHISDKNEFDLETALKFADIALYKTKQNRGVHFAFFEDKMAAEIEYYRTLEGDLRKALAQNEIYIVYQPQVLSSNYEVVAYEALARWNHPKYGTISPDIFISIAEDRGLIHELGEMVLHQCCLDLPKLQKINSREIKISVNLSPSQFHIPEMVTSFKTTFEKNKVPASSFIMEVTESLFIKNLEHTRATLEKLREMGVTIALDDFGTGYSSLSYLKEFKVDCVKLDRAFVKDVVDSKPDQRIVEGIVTLVKNLGLEVVGEGIESEEQLAYLHSVGCQKIQGFYTGRPQKVEDLVAFAK